MTNIDVSKKDSSHFGVYARVFIPKDTLVFSKDEWEGDETNWQTLTIDEYENLNHADKHLFTRYCYDKDFNSIVGTFDWNKAVHISNFINHACEPTLKYDDNDNIIANRNVEIGEELTLDYGTFVVNMNQEFTCICGSENCRKQILKDDWKFLYKTYGYGFPKFIHEEIDKLIKEDLEVVYY